MSKIKSLIQIISRPKRLKALLSYNNKGYLNKIGWFNAFDSKESVDENGNPLPWVTYSFIDFIKNRLNKQHKVFEFGSGNSTYFYAKYAEKVVSVEHDKKWYNKLHNSMPENSNLIYCELSKNGDYCRAPIKLNEKFDIVIVDGRDRVNCCIQATDALSNNGVVILDDSERDIYQDGVQYLINNGFKQISFSGISPGLFYLKSTSVFYKSNNCLNI